MLSDWHNASGFSLMAYEPVFDRLIELSCCIDPQNPLYSGVPIRSCSFRQRAVGDSHESDTSHRFRHLKGDAAAHVSCTNKPDAHRSALALPPIQGTVDDDHNE